MNVGDLVKRARFPDGSSVDSRIGILVNKFHEPFPGTGIWNVLWQDGIISGGHWNNDLELINESR